MTINISDEQVAEIVRRYYRTDTSYDKLARRFGVSAGTIQNIVDAKGRFKDRPSNAEILPHRVLPSHERKPKPRAENLMWCMKMPTGKLMLRSMRETEDAAWLRGRTLLMHDKRPSVSILQKQGYTVVRVKVEEVK